MSTADADWERRLAEAWSAADSLSEAQLRELIERLAAELPPESPVGLFERAGSFDSTGRSDLAVPLYRRALDGGLTGERRRRAVIQLASSLRNIDEAEESVALLRAELYERSDQLDDAVHAGLPRPYRLRGGSDPCSGQHPPAFVSSGARAPGGIGIRKPNRGKFIRVTA